MRTLLRPMPLGWWSFIVVVMLLGGIILGISSVTGNGPYPPGQFLAGLTLFLLGAFLRKRTLDAKERKDRARREAWVDRREREEAWLRAQETPENIMRALNDFSFGGGYEDGLCRRSAGILIRRYGLRGTIPWDDIAGTLSEGWESSGVAPNPTSMWVAIANLLRFGFILEQDEAGSGLFSVSPRFVEFVHRQAPPMPEDWEPPVRDATPVKDAHVVEKGV